MENKTCRRCALFDPKLCGYVKMGKIKEENNFIISPLTLTAEQYDAMSKMGLYSGKKSILFEKE